MKKVKCVKERVFYQKHIYNLGDCVNMEEDVFVKAPKGCFEEVDKRPTPKKIEKVETPKE